jgi:DNA repair protein SbcD/Mre11
LQNELAKVSVRKNAQYNTFVAHGAWTGGRYLGMGEFNEQRLPEIESYLGQEFDYIALGHYHKHLAVRDHALYSGSTERTSLNEAGNSCGFLLVDLDSKSTEYHQISTRPMLKLPPLNCAQMNAAEIYQALQVQSGTQLNNAVVSIALENVEAETFIKLDMREIEAIFSQVFCLEKHLLKKSAGSVRSGSVSHIESLGIEFERYLATIGKSEFDLQRLKKLGYEYLEVDNS